MRKFLRFSRSHGVSLSLTTILFFSLTSTVSADDRLNRYLDVLEESLNASTLLYSRISPEVAKKINSVAMPDNAAEVGQCVLDEAKSAGLLAEFDQTIVLSEEFVDYLRDTPTLTMFTVESDPGLKQLQERMTAPRFQPFTQISKDCGVIKMNMQATSSSGVMDAMKEIMAAAENK